ncbi:MAG TPA: CHASE4 domain-containing protein, partial [Caulobacter sp.]|nr:CHASE4 domain-containing protein [Caulobacter sp.]
MDGRNIELKIFGLIAGMAAGMILLAGFALTVATRHADARERQYEQTLVGNGLRQRGQEVQAALNPYVIWDEAIIKLDNQFDQAWASQNIGASLGGAPGYKVVYVLDAGDTPIYGHLNGKDVAPDTYARYAAPTAPLVKAIREIETDPKKVAALRAVHKSRVELIGDEPVLITVSLVRPDLKAKTRGARAPLLVTGIPVANSVVKAFADRFLLHQTHIAIVKPEQLDTKGAQTVLGRATDGRRIVLRWTPRQPG